MRKIIHIPSMILEFPKHSLKLSVTYIDGSCAVDRIGPNCSFPQVLV